MIADLAMYDWPEMQATNDAYWSEVAQRLKAGGIEAPDWLSRTPETRAAWRDPTLLIGQTCGMPYVSGHCGSAILVGRPDYGLSGASNYTYRSAIVARRGGAPVSGPEALLRFAGSRVAVNEWPSYSGHIALRAHLAGLREGADTAFFGSFVMSGGHRSSAGMVAAGEADIAALDWVAWELLQLHERETAEVLEVIDQTAPAPSLPFITAPSHAHEVAILASALDAAARSTGPVTGLPRRVALTADTEFAHTRAAARRSASERFAPDAPEVPASAMD